MKLRCVIVEDEPLASECLAKYVSVIDYLDLVAIAQNAIELNRILEEKTVDLIFMDIEMPYMSGLDFMKIRANLPLTILTTAYPDYAIEGFHFDVVDYLLKPITFNRFLKAVNKAKELYALKNQRPLSVSSQQDHIFIKCENKYERIFINDILFIQALENYVTIQCNNAKYMTLLPLKTVEQYFDDANFLRVHKSYIVSLDKIQSIDNNEIKISQFIIPVSRNLKEQVLQLVVKNRLLGK